MTVDISKYASSKAGSGSGPKKAYITYVMNENPSNEREKTLNAGYAKVRELRSSGVDVEALVYGELLSKL